MAEVNLNGQLQVQVKDLQKPLTNDVFARGAAVLAQRVSELTKVMRDQGAAHAYVIAPAHHVTEDEVERDCWMAYCLACSDTAEDYVFPCLVNHNLETPPQALMVAPWLEQVVEPEPAEET